ncbi:efflux RND transporter periplasmic adaptor subunit [Staphylococcus sp. SS87]|nr:efflux RND transporter periplasmic adaptor subunit [Staphylococcus singaporensis]MBE5672503.1 efflux RND transporter periplasmic adaptor subunit [Staphylococcus singaporensis]MBE5675863.1 efflux RND transporter periplasmic adaptor subunit [Staphylococcus singaporensis]MBE5677668.1 efflux RND transporter periplasmic adaptor subunit [Staphylococcus singaporensis]
MRSKRKWLIVICVLLLLITISQILKHFNYGTESKEEYNTYTVEKERYLDLQGKAYPREVKTYYKNNQVGTYLGVQVVDGQTVKKGDILINYKINSNKRQQLIDKINDAQNIITEVYLNISKDSNNRELQQKLTENKQILYDAQQQLYQYDSQNRDSMYASFDGKIMIENIENDSDNRPILHLISKNSQIKTSVSEFDLNKVKKGDKVNLSITSTGKTGKGIIKQISELPISYEENLSLNENDSMQLPESNNDGTSSNSKLISTSPILKGYSNSELSRYRVIIDELSLPIRAGYSLEIKVPLNVIKVPKSVLTKDNNVFIVNKNNIVEKRNIHIKRINGEIFVEKGLKPGEKLIKQPKNTLNDGDKVEVSS